MSESLEDQLEGKIDSQINAAEMEPGKVYMNASGKIRVVLLRKDDGAVFVQAWSDMHQEWRTVRVEETYKVRLPNKGELEMAEATANEVKEKVEPQKLPPKYLGKVRGLKMLATWGQVYKDVGTQGLEAVKAAMLEEFPEEADSINRWARAYKSYYNAGRLPGVEKPAQPLMWPSEKKLEREAAKAARAQARLEEKEAKKAVREKEKAEKQAAKEAKRAAAEAAKAAKKAANTPDTPTPQA